MTETEGGPKEAWLAQGVGVPSVCVTGDGKDFLCCYTEWSNRLKRGVQICAARCPIDDVAQSNPWKKYSNGRFGEPGLGGHETPVMTAGTRADTYDAHVQWVEKWQRYVLVFGCGLHSEVLSKPPKAIESGLFVTTSKDGVTWAKPVRIETVFPLVIVTQPCKVHPTLMISSVSEKKLTGRLVYGWTPEWPRESHCLGGRAVTLTLGGKGPAPAKQ